ncbi:hypothetical protein HID58_001556 [Brassica napus]|uniref:Uncharacterized protein n=1 Tax=Brassica napus TaxID=3708 RepID=A0ABQ8EJZ2_BRANA|nr:hypothetical protein HID58_001556 [Brassica napus]
MMKRKGFEEIVKQSWGVDSTDTSNTMARIIRCKRRIKRWKRQTDLNSRERISRLKTLLEKEVWNVHRVRQLFEEEDVAMVLNTPFNIRVSDAIVWGFSRNGSYDSKSDSSMHSGASWIIRDFRVIIEISSPQALEALNNPARCPGLANLIERTRQALHRFHNCSILVVNSVVNLVAGKIAVSVTNDGRFSSYIARGGPRWLSDIICADAANSPFPFP